MYFLWFYIYFFHCRYRMVRIFLLLWTCSLTKKNQLVWRVKKKIKTKIKYLFNVFHYWENPTILTHAIQSYTMMHMRAMPVHRADSYRHPIRANPFFLWSFYIIRASKKRLWHAATSSTKPLDHSISTLISEKGRERYLKKNEPIYSYPFTLSQKGKGLEGELTSSQGNNWRAIFIN